MDFKKEYNRNDFLLYLRTVLLPGDFKTDPRPLSAAGGKPGCITGIARLGLSASLNVTVLEIEHSSPNDPRVTLSRETFRLMRQYNIRNALAAYISTTAGEWRLSLVTSDLEYDEKNDRVIREFSNPRRSSFLLGPKALVGTATKKLIKQGAVSAFTDLSERFSLKVVNKEFYDEIAKLFTELCGGTRNNGKADVEYPGILKLPAGDRKTGQEFAVRLIGRIVFCWFLKQRDLVGNAWLTSKGARGMPGYYHGHIEPLFFEILNTPLAQRRSAFRTADADRIPFLNGGLFAPHRNDFYDFDEATGISTSLNTLKIPDDWLARLFDILESYNFTIDENTTVDVDLSIDPEMLGRIFENLLAEINPETGETARNKSGSFYTPRPIVEYMATESLVSYLARKLAGAGGVDGDGIEERLRPLFAYEKDASESGRFTDAERDAIIDAFHAMRCLDPACGSGAFPMGVLQKTLLALEKLDPSGEAFLERQLVKIENESARAITEEMLREKGYQYVHKLTLVQDCIYGIDIQPIAVEMSRLRAFLALIVDETINEREPNRGIRPLPNLEFKFVCANTLVHLPSNGDQLLSHDNIDLLGKMKSVRSAYIGAQGDRKMALRNEFTEKQKILFDQLIGWHSEPVSAERAKGGSRATELSLWDPFGDDECPWFDSFWMFGIGDEGRSHGTNGFDIVIGNPPYVQLQSIFETSDALTKEGYKTFAKSSDLYALFYERGAELLRNGGTLCYISSNTWMSTKYGHSLRAFFLNEGQFSQLIDFGDAPIFENTTTYTNIALWRKGHDSGTDCRVWDLSHIFANDENLPGMLASNPLGYPFFTEKNYVIAEAAKAGPRKRIEEIGIPFVNWNIPMYRGVLTGLNDAFIIDQTKYDELVAADPKSAEILKPLLRGCDIKRYKKEWAGMYLVASHNAYVDSTGKKIPAVNVEQGYPTIFKYLKSIGDAIERKEIEVRGSGLYTRCDQGDHWSNLRDCAYWEDFSKKKIGWGNLAQKPQFTLIDEGFVINAPSPFIPDCPELRYLLAVLNSSITRYYLAQICVERSGGYYEYKPMFVEQIPITHISETDQIPFNILVDMIQDARKAGLDTEGDYLEKVVDLMVYALYFRPEAERDGLYITDEVMKILGDKPVSAHAIPSVTGKLTANPLIAAAVGKGVPL